MTTLTASEFTSVVRLPNDVNRAAGAVRNFAEHYRSDQPTSRKRLLSFRAVQARLASAVPHEFTDLLRRSKTGIRIVSDAHLEWLDLDGLPLFVRKNVTHIPVTPGNLFVDQLSMSRTLILTPEAFRKVLVLSALDPANPISGLFDAAFQAFEPEWRGKIEVEVVHVDTVDKLVSAINAFDGPMMVFDGHGGHERGEPAKLFVGTEEVDIWSLRGRITRMPPIVVLSACDTHAADRNHAQPPTA